MVITHVHQDHWGPDAPAKVTDRVRGVVRDARAGCPGGHDPPPAPTERPGRAGRRLCQNDVVSAEVLNLSSPTQVGHGWGADQAAGHHRLLETIEARLVKARAAARPWTFKLTRALGDTVSEDESAPSAKGLRHGSSAALLRARLRSQIARLQAEDWGVRGRRVIYRDSGSSTTRPPSFRDTARAVMSSADRTRGCSRRSAGNTTEIAATTSRPGPTMGAATH